MDEYDVFRCRDGPFPQALDALTAEERAGSCTASTHWPRR
jgi:hypothetical protein